MRGLVSCLVLLGLVGCGEPSEVPPPADSGSDEGFSWPDADAGVVAPPLPGRGLNLIAQIEQPTPGPHLVELVSLDDVVYVANSNDQFSAHLLEADGGMLTTLVRPPPFEEHVRCTTLAVHAASRTLYCSADEAHRILTFDLTDPERPTLRDLDALVFPRLFTRDIAVIGEHLYLARFDGGLWTSSIAPDGSLEPPVATTVTGNVRFVDGEDPIVAVSDRSLLLLAGRGREVKLRSELPLEGPPQDLRVVGDRALVALASAGVAIVDLSSGAPRLERMLEPPGVATSVDQWNDALAVMTLTGAFLYDMRASPPRLAGFAPSGQTPSRDDGVMLDGRFVDGELIVSDWTLVERYAIDLDGAVLDADHPRGIYLAPGSDATVPFRNVGDRPMAIHLQVGDEALSLDLAPGSTGSLTVAAEAIAALSEHEGRRLLHPMAVVDEQSTTSTVFLVVRPEETSPLERPAPTDAFPTIAMADGALDVFHLPSPGIRQRLNFYTTDCAAMWPVIEDQAYLWRRGELDDGAELYLLGRQLIGGDGWNVRWGLTDVPYGHYDVFAPPRVREENGEGDVYERFRIDELPAAAAHPTDYVVGEDGVVERVERYYRGRHALR